MVGLGPISVLGLLFASLTSSVLSTVIPVDRAHDRAGSEQLRFLPVPETEGSHEGAKEPFDTSSLIFTSLRAHLLSWDSTFAPNGFGVVPATIPTGTIMYHTRRAGPPPTSGLDWFAFDAEHSYIFGGGGSYGAVMWHFAAARPLRVLYFDGASAAKSPGPVDLQEVIAFGRAPTSGGFNDWERFTELCKWAEHYELDGFVREEGTFEYIHCDFASDALDLVRGTDINVAVSNSSTEFPGPGRPMNGLAQLFEDEPPKRPPHGGGPGGGGPPRRGLTSVYQHQAGWLYWRATAWHHEIPEPRVRTYPEYLVTLYDPSFTSLAATVRLPRGAHSLANLSTSDIAHFKAEMDQALLAWNSRAPTSGVDWAGIASAATSRYSDHLAELRQLLADRTSISNTTSIIDQVRLITFAMLEPYLSGPGILSVWPSPPSPSARIEALASTSKICAEGFTEHLRTKRMTRQELRLKGATEGVLRRICDVATGTLGDALEILDGGARSDLKGILAVWDLMVEVLMEWLAWPGWTRCPRQCAWDEICFIPAPMMNPQPGVEPKCIRNPMWK